MTPAHPGQPSTTNPTFQFLIGRMTSANRSESYKMTDIHPCIHPMTSDNRSTLRATKGFMFRITLFNYHSMKMVLAFDNLQYTHLLCFQQHCKKRMLSEQLSLLAASCWSGMGEAGSASLATIGPDRLPPLAATSTSSPARHLS